jgi:MarR family transcriptional regulator for hemolysin
MRQAIDAELRAYGLTEATWRPLAYLRRLGPGVRQKDLAAALGIEGPSLVRLLDGLERQGLVERRPDDVDRRAYGLHLTEPGRRLHERVDEVIERVNAQALAGVGNEELALCYEVFARIERVLDGTEGAVPARRPRRRVR